MKFTLIILTFLFFISCQDNFNQKQVKLEVFSTLKTIGEKSTIKVDNFDEKINIKIKPEFPIFDHDLHMKTIISLLIYKLFKNEDPKDVNFELYKENGSKGYVLYSKRKVKDVVKLYSDTTLLSMVEYVANEFNQFDPGILDHYIDRVLTDFPMLKNNNTNYSFYNVFQKFHLDCIKNKDKGEGQNIFVTLYKMDKELDILKSNNRYSKLIKGIWDVTTSISIDSAERNLFPKQSKEAS